MALVSYKCPNCGGSVVFDPKKQKFCCEFCMSEFTEEEMKAAALSSTETSGVQDGGDTSGTAGTEAQAESGVNAKAGIETGADQISDMAQSDRAGSTDQKEDALVYICPSCGAEVVTDATTAATFCYYCHNPVVLAGKLSGGMKQKLGLACTLVGDPKVLLLDEPGVGVDPISRRELWQMVHELAGDGMLILWSTSYLDEAEQCRDVLLMNEGKLLYQGEPTALTQTMAGRSFLVSSPQENNRRLLQRALKLPQVSDGVIQGKSVRLILKKEARIDEVQEHDDMPPLQVADTAPRFEDAFIDLLGGAGTAESPLGAIIHRVDGSKDETVIEAQSLTKKFGDFAATDHVDFQVKRGEIFGLLGPNGAGKSTTFKMMCGLLVPTSGKALVLGMDLKVSSGKARQHLGYMAQKFSLYGNLSVEQNLRFFSGVYGLRGRAQNDKIARMSDAFGLNSIARHAADELPLGYKQRLALACSLMHEPDILFLDEPTSGVDPLTRREFWLHINSMVDKGVTVMVTTHFMDEAEYCDRIGLVYHGKLIASGTPDALKAQAADDNQTDPTMEQAFITLINRWDKENGHEQ